MKPRFTPFLAACALVFASLPLSGSERSATHASLPFYESFSTEEISRFALERLNRKPLMDTCRAIGGEEKCRKAAARCSLVSECEAWLTRQAGGRVALPKPRSKPTAQSSAEAALAAKREAALKPLFVSMKPRMLQRVLRACSNESVFQGKDSCDPTAACDLSGFYNECAQACAENAGCRDKVRMPRIKGAQARGARKAPAMCPGAGRQVMSWGQCFQGVSGKQGPRRPVVQANPSCSGGGMMTRITLAADGTCGPKAGDWHVTAVKTCCL